MTFILTWCLFVCLIYIPVNSLGHLKGNWFLPEETQTCFEIIYIIIVVCAAGTELNMMIIVTSPEIRLHRITLGETKYNSYSQLCVITFLLIWCTG